MRHFGIQEVPMIEVQHGLQLLHCISFSVLLFCRIQMLKLLSASIKYCVYFYGPGKLVWDVTEVVCGVTCVTGTLFLTWRYLKKCFPLRFLRSLKKCDEPSSRKQPRNLIWPDMTWSSFLPSFKSRFCGPTASYRVTFHSPNKVQRFHLNPGCICCLITLQSRLWCDVVVALKAKIAILALKVPQGQEETFKGFLSEFCGASFLCCCMIE